MESPAPAPETVAAAAAAAPFGQLQVLPPELRLAIYEHLFRDAKAVLTGGFVGVSRKRAKARDRRWQLLLAGRAVHAEALPVYWAAASRLRAYMATAALLALLPAPARDHLATLSCRRAGLAAGTAAAPSWPARLARMRAALPRLRTVLVEEATLRLDADVWRALDAEGAVAARLLPLPLLVKGGGERDGDNDDDDKDEGDEEDAPAQLDETERQRQESLLCLSTATWPRNRVLFRKLRVSPDPRCMVPYVGSYPGFCPTKVFYLNLANGKAAVVFDSEKAQGLRSVLDW